VGLALMLLISDVFLYAGKIDQPKRLRVWQIIFVEVLGFVAAERWSLLALARAYGFII